MRRAISILLISSIFSSGCARELVVRPERPAQYTPGLPVALAFTQFEIAANWVGDIVSIIDPSQRLARETAYLNGLKERRDDWQAPQPAPADETGASRPALAADAAILNAQIANLQARLTLQGLQARTVAR